MSHMRKEVKVVAIIVAATLVLILIEGELATRYFHLESDVLITLDACTGFKSMPNARGYTNGSGNPGPITINSAGFRDVEHAIEKEEGVTRILILGDSLTEATQVPLEETFWRQLQTLMDREERHTEVISFGIASFGTNQELLAYECYGRQYEPDIVVLGFFDGNDLADNYFRSEPFVPRFSLADGTLSLDEKYKDQVAERRARRATLFPGILYWVKDNSSFLRMLYNKFQLVRKGQTTENDVQETNQIFLKEYPDGWEEAWAITDALIGRLKEGKLVVMHIPALEQLQQERVPKKELYDFDKPTKRLNAIAQKHRLTFIDLYPALLEAQQTKPINFTTDVHLNKNGHRVVAKTMWQELRKVIPIQ
jgi:lysophospholipase L1-like esterase